jgi:hypothetical protein
VWQQQWWRLHYVHDNVHTHSTSSTLTQSCSTLEYCTKYCEAESKRWLQNKQRICDERESIVVVKVFCCLYTALHVINNCSYYSQHSCSVATGISSAHSNTNEHTLFICSGMPVTSSGFTTCWRLPKLLFTACALLILLYNQHRRSCAQRSSHLQLKKMRINILSYTLGILSTMCA